MIYNNILTNSRISIASSRLCFHCLRHVFYSLESNPLFESRVLRGSRIILLLAVYKRVYISHVPYLSERKLTTINIISNPQDSSKSSTPLRYATGWAVKISEVAVRSRLNLPTIVNLWSRLLSKETLLREAFGANCVLHFGFYWVEDIKICTICWVHAFINNILWKAADVFFHKLDI